MNGAAISSEQAEWMSFNGHFAQSRCSSWEAIFVIVGSDFCSTRFLCQKISVKGKKISKKNAVNEIKHIWCDSRTNANKLAACGLWLLTKSIERNIFKDHSTTCHSTTRRFVRTVTKSQNLLDKWKNVKWNILYDVNMDEMCLCTWLTRLGRREKGTDDVTSVFGVST